jgi:hypothetical protein
MAQVVSRRSFTVEIRVQDRVGPCRICGGQSGTKDKAVPLHAKKALVGRGSIAPTYS